MPCKSGSEGSFKKFRQKFLALVASFFRLLFCLFSHQISMKGLLSLFWCRIRYCTYNRVRFAWFVMSANLLRVVGRGHTQKKYVTSSMVNARYRDVLMSCLYYSVRTVPGLLGETAQRKSRSPPKVTSLKDRAVLGRFKFCLSLKRWYHYFVDIFTVTWWSTGYLNFVCQYIFYSCHVPMNFHLPMEGKVSGYVNKGCPLPHFF